MQTSTNHSIVRKYTCRVKIILILLSLITKGVDVKRRN